MGAGANNWEFQGGNTWEYWVGVDDFGFPGGLMTSETQGATWELEIWSMHCAEA